MELLIINTGLMAKTVVLPTMLDLAECLTKLIQKIAWLSLIIVSPSPVKLHTFALVPSVRNELPHSNIPSSNVSYCGGVYV